MAGNVWEWTLSLEGEYPYNPEDGREDPEAVGRRVVRGGAFYLDEEDVRCAFRVRLSPDHHGASRGFRVVVSPL
jgi:formylglycine-generating enzyme required for sulfatase activity